MSAATLTPVKSKRPLMVAALAIALALGGTAWLLLDRDTVSTDNAYLKADATAVPPQVAGLVLAVRVQENQYVKTGELLVELDPEDYVQRVRAAQADVAQARAGFAAVRASLARHGSQQRLALANVDEVTSKIRAADAQRDQTLADRERYRELLVKQLAPRERYDAMVSGAVQAEAESLRVRAALNVARRQRQVIDTQQAELLAQEDSAQAAVLHAEAALAVAQRNLERTRVVAPISGVVGNRRVQRGEYVQVGATLMTIVPVADLYVVANFKETQTAHMLVGQSARIAVDAVPGLVLNGRIESLAPGSGSEFALLPFEPANGNFTKIVQRVPVRIRLDAAPAALASLRSGLSAEVAVDLRAPPPRLLANTVR